MIKLDTLNDIRSSKFKQKELGRAFELLKKYKKILANILNPDEAINKEIRELNNNTYHNFTDENNFVDTILRLKTWKMTDNKPKLTIHHFEKALDCLTFTHDSKYLLSNFINNPICLIDIEHSCLNFDIAYFIHTSLKIPIDDDLFIDKWCISLINTSKDGSFYKILDFKEYGWYNHLQNFCEKNNIDKNKFKALKSILKNNLIPHKNKSNYYADKKYVDLEKSIGDNILNLYIEDEEDAYHIEEITHHINNYENEKQITFEDEQRTAIIKGIQKNFTIVTGCPGTGKSTIADCIVSFFKKKNISLIAPTGKASKGIVDKCKDNINTNICGTLHRMTLCIYKYILKRKYNEPVPDKYTSLPRHVDIIILDEASMVDIFMFQVLINWCKKFNCKLIMLGDIQQLPPVGKGQPFVKLIECGIFVDNVVTLTKIKRQDDGLLKNCILSYLNKNLKQNNFDQNSTKTIEHDFKNTYDTVNKFNEIFNEYGQENAIVISPEHKGYAGTEQLNELLQCEIFNRYELYKVANFKNNDKVMRIKNKYDEDVSKVNGDSGKLTIETKEIADPKKPNRTIMQTKYIVTYDDDNYEEEISKDTLYEEFCLNYCNTVHKYQGSQGKTIIVCISNEHSSLKYNNARKLVYTAISRAKENLIIIGNINLMFQSQKIQPKPFITSFMEEFEEYDC